MFAEITSSNVVGYQNKGVAYGDRAMRAVSTFLPVGGTAASVKLGDVKQAGGYVSAFTLTTYDDNVTSQKEYWFFDETAAEEAGGIDVGWYELTEDEDENIVPDIEKGVQNDVELPLGQGCVIVSVDDDTEYTSAGEVDSIVREFNVPNGARKMTGNVLPKDLNLGQIKQVGGFVSAFTLTTYDNNVTSQKEYWYFDDTAAEEAGGIDVGWYELTEDEDENIVPDIEKGVQNFNVPSGQGFVVVSVDDDTVLQFPKAF